MGLCWLPLAPKVEFCRQLALFVARNRCFSYRFLFLGFFHFIIFVLTKKQQWAASLCHSLVLHTNVDL